MGARTGTWRPSPQAHPLQISGAHVCVRTHRAGSQAHTSSRTRKNAHSHLPKHTQAHTAGRLMRPPGPEPNCFQVPARGHLVATGRRTRRCPTQTRYAPTGMPVPVPDCQPDWHCAAASGTAPDSDSEIANYALCAAASSWPLLLGSLLQDSQAPGLTQDSHWQAPARGLTGRLAVLA